MFSISIEEIKKIRSVIKLKYIVEDLKDTLELITLDYSLIEDVDSFNSDISHVEEEIDSVYRFVDSSESNQEVDMNYDFLLENCKYKIFFAGKSYEDLNALESNTLIQVIKKFTTPLATETIVPLTEGMDHLRGKSGLSVFRIQVANDYRIAYMRTNDVTVILGISRKNGKDADYTRYDSIGKNSVFLYKEIEMFREGTLPNDHLHYKCLDLINNFLLKKQIGLPQNETLESNKSF